MINFADLSLKLLFAVIVFMLIIFILIVFGIATTSEEKSNKAYDRPIIRNTIEVIKPSN